MERLARAGNPLLVNTVDDFEQLLDFVFVERPDIPGPLYLAEQAIAQSTFNAEIFRDVAESSLALEPALKDNPVPALIV